MKNFVFKKEYLFALTIFVLLWVGLSLITKAMFSGFHLTDDYAILRINQSIKQNGLLSTLVQYMTPELLQRLRPLYTPFKVIRAGLFGTNYSIWSIHLLISAIISSFLFFVFARVSKFSFLESILFPIFLLFGLQSIIWFHLSYDETQGMIFLSAAFACLALSIYGTKHNKAYNGLFIFFTALTSLSKEPFILLIPAMVYLKYYLNAESLNIPLKDSIKKDYGILALLVLFVLSILFLKFGVKTMDFGYCGVSGFTPLAYFDTFMGLSMASNYMNLIVLTVFLFCLFDKNRSQLILKFAKENLHVFVTFALVVIPQCIIYSKSGYYNRYLLPSLLGYAFLTISVLRFFRLNLKSKVRSFLLYSLVIVSIFSIFKKTYLMIQRYSDEGFATNNVIQLIDKKAAKDKKIVIVGDTAVNFEQTQAFKVYLELLQNRKTTVYFYPFFISNPNSFSPFDKQLVETFNKQFKIDHSVQKNDDVLIVFDNVNSTFSQQNTDKLQSYRVYDFNNYKVYLKNGIK